MTAEKKPERCDIKIKFDFELWIFQERLLLEIWLKS